MSTPDAPAQRTCAVEGCERRSAMPEPYRAECARHHLQAVDRAVRDAERQFQARMAELKRAKGIPG